VTVIQQPSLVYYAISLCDATREYYVTVKRGREYYVTVKRGVKICRSVTFWITSG
jgi:hypothetical protein